MFPLNFNDKDKFEVRAFENCKMIGYGDTDGIYWIYNTENHKIFRSRDVKFTFYLEGIHSIWKVFKLTFSNC